MSHVQKSNWRPSVSLKNLKLRAQMLEKIRAFFKARNVLEVETPLLEEHGVTEPNIQSIKTTNNKYLQTSPEYYMKRMLAAGSGSIFQICKAFRDEESGRFHNPEFTMLEWYRTDFDHTMLMDEVEALLHYCLGTNNAERLTYRDCFLKHVDCDPITASIDDLNNIIKTHKINAPTLTDKDQHLDLIMTHLIEPKLKSSQLTFIYDYPASQAALSIIRDNKFAERFELYYQGIELANGYHELRSSQELRQRFHDNNNKRQADGKPIMPIDEKLLSAIHHGLPPCAGVALGVDRLVLLAAGAASIDEIINI